MVIIMKNIGYPYPIIKNIYLTIGAPHSQSHVMTLLNWLVTILRYRDCLEEEEE
jgi:hypothetical protein